MSKNKSSFSLEPVIGAGDGTRTRDIRLGKPTLYQLSYARKECGFIQFLYLHVNNKKNSFIQRVPFRSSLSEPAVPLF